MQHMLVFQPYSGVNRRAGMKLYKTVARLPDPSHEELQLQALAKSVREVLSSFTKNDKWAIFPRGGAT